jgi:hypothetical protein
MSSAASVEDVLEIAQRLSTVDKVRLIERVSAEVETEISGRDRPSRRSAWGLCRDLGGAPSAEAIAENRREMLAGFPRGDV